MSSTTWFALVCLLAATPAVAQVPLTLDEAVDRALTKHGEARAAALAVQEAGEQVAVARSAALPRVDISEGWQRGNLPVFAFSSLLSQRQFTAADFDLSRLNHPAARDDVHTAIAVEQPLYDPAIAAGLRRAEVGRESAVVSRRQALERLQLETTAAYARVLQVTALLAAASDALAASTQDRDRAGARRDAGMATDADVLMADVQVATVRANQIEARGELAVARAHLNDLVDLPLDTSLELAPMAAVDEPTGSVPDLEAEALARRADVQAARLRERAAASGRETARAAFLPRIVARGLTEWHGATPGAQTPAWTVGVEARLNVFGGFADRARLASAHLAMDRRQVERERVEASARLEVRTTLARRESASARVEVAAAAVRQAVESQRIVRDRYDGGLADVVVLLRASQAVLDARAQQIAAESDLLQQQAALQVALGRGGR